LIVPLDCERLATDAGALWLRLTMRVAGHPFHLSLCARGLSLATVAIEDASVHEIAIDCPLPEAVCVEDGRLVKLDFDIRKTFCPAEMGYGGDTRRLGLALRAFRLWRRKAEAESFQLKPLLARRKWRSVLMSGGCSAAQAQDVVGLLGSADGVYFSPWPPSSGDPTDAGPGFCRALASFGVTGASALSRAGAETLLLSGQPDLILCWSIEALRHCLEILKELPSTVRGYPDIIVRSVDASMLYHIGLSHRVPFERFMNNSDLLLLPDWIYLRAHQPC
jgi:hypothetical protein